MESRSALDFAYQKKRIFDQMASMHFRLSDRYRFYTRAEDTFEIISSVLLCGLTFFDYEKYTELSASASTAYVGVISILIFAFTLIKQKLSFSQLSEKHNIAGKMYSQAKLDITSKIYEWSINCVSDKYILDYINEHYSSLNELPQIPEKQFNKLKHCHQSKIEMSKFLDEHKNDFWLFCKIKFWFRNFRRK